VRDFLEGARRIELHGRLVELRGATCSLMGASMSVAFKTPSIEPRRSR
jgi:hypothetical protein